MMSDSRVPREEKVTRKGGKQEIFKKNAPEPVEKDFTTQDNPAVVQVQGPVSQTGERVQFEVIRGKTEDTAAREARPNQRVIKNGKGQSIEYQENTILVQRTIRSGQSLYYPGNIVIMGDVNPGAEVVAGGNIVVMGWLRGVAHAGATGDEQTMVTAFRLQPTQLRIANHITRAPDGDKIIPDEPEVALVKNGVVVIENYPPDEENNPKLY
ncbi:MAG: septum site-determining protein MinC [Bacillota bacterium]